MMELVQVAGYCDINLSLSLSLSLSPPLQSCVDGVQYSMNQGDYEKV